VIKTTSRTSLLGALLLFSCSLLTAKIPETSVQIVDDGGELSQLSAAITAAGAADLISSSEVAGALGRFVVVFDSDEDSLGGGSGDYIEYLVSAPITGEYYFWARLYSPEAPGSDAANSFFVSIDGGTLWVVGNNRDLNQQWHWAGDGAVEQGAPAALALGTLDAGSHLIRIEKREAGANPPMLNIAIITTDPNFVPTDEAFLTAYAIVPVPTPTPEQPDNPNFAFEAENDFTYGDSLAWAGDTFAGLGGTYYLGTEQDLSGLCMGVSGPDPEGLIWVGPERMVDLKDNTLYRVRVAASTDQTAPDAIPFWDMTYDNFGFTATDPPAPFLNFGGSQLFIDVAGGASGIGRPQGRSEFEMWMAPNAISTDAWRSESGGAYDPANSDLTGMRVMFRLIDTNPALNFEQDWGTICIQRVRIDSIGIDQLAQTTVYDAPIHGDTHAWYGFGFTRQPGSIDNSAAVARLALDPAGAVDGDHFGPQIAASGADTVDVGGTPVINALKFYPVAWEADTLYCVEADLRMESSEADPVDVIALVIDVPTNEMIASHWSTRSAPGAPMDRAASPRLATSTYRAYWFSHNVTAVSPESFPNAARVRPILQFFNRADLGGVGPSGGDALLIEGLRMARVTIPE